MFLKIFNAFFEDATHFFKQVNIRDNRKCKATAKMTRSTVRILFILF